MKQTNIIMFKKGLAQLSDNFYVYLMPNGDWGLTNAGFVVSGEEILMIDTMWSLELTQEILDAVAEKLPGKKITRAINSHHNGDHWWGNQLLPKDIEIISSQNFLDRLAKEHSSTDPSAMCALQNAAHTCTGFASDYITDAFAKFDWNNIELRKPNRFFTGRLELAHGEIPLVLEEIGHAHSGSDIVIFVPSERVLFAADLIFYGAHIITWTGDMDSWIESVETMLRYEADTFVPGHGPVIGRDGLIKYKSYLEEVRDHGLSQHKAGKTYLEAAYSFDFSKYPDWIGEERMIINYAHLFSRITGEPALGFNEELMDEMGKMKTWVESNKAKV